MGPQVLAAVPALASLFGGKGSTSSSSSNASNVLNIAFNPNVFAATGGGTYTPSSSGSPSGNASGSPSADSSSSPSSSIPWLYGSGTAARSDIAQPYIGGNSGGSTNNTMVLMLMLGVGALYMVSRS